MIKHPSSFNTFITYYFVFQINWVGSNFHNPSRANSGSGLFTTEGVIDYYHNVSLNSGGKLVTAELPVHPNKLKTQINWNDYYDLNEADYSVDGLNFFSVIYGDVFNMTEMDPSKNEVCMKQILQGTIL